jgi:hypothetical protein
MAASWVTGLRGNKYRRIDVNGGCRAVERGLCSAEAPSSVSMRSPSGDLASIEIPVGIKECRLARPDHGLGLFRGPPACVWGWPWPAFRFTESGDANAETDDCWVCRSCTRVFDD